MLSFLKKKSDAGAAPTVPPWHPNFRNYEQLPDIKVVRTAFFVNVAAVSVTLGLAIYFGSNEWQLRSLRAQAAEQVRRAEKSKPASDKAVADFKKFQAEEAKLGEVEAFVKSKPTLSPLLLHLGETLPPNIAIDSVDLREAGLTLRLSVKGTPDVASGYATQYRDQLIADKDLQATFGDATFTSLTPSPGTGRLTVEIVLPAKTPAKK